MAKTLPTKKTKSTTRRPAKKSTIQTPSKEPSVTAEYIKAIVFAVVLALFIRTFVVQAFRIPSGSMEDTLLIGDFLLANKFIYGAQVPFTNTRLPALRDPQPNDIVIFQYPEDPSRDFIKRLIAGPGQTVEVRNKILFVDGKRSIDPAKSKYIDPRIINSNDPGSIRDNYGPAIVPKGHYFVMGDNRDNSEDSRYWGFLNHELIHGQAFMLYWSWAPDDNAPTYTGLVSIPNVLFYNIIHFPARTRWTRLGMLIE
jgi:signal peptidase I